MTPLALPGGRATQLGPPVLDDGALTALTPGGTLILLGPATADSIERAAAGGAAAVVLRGEAADAIGLSRAGDRAGIAVLSVSSQLPWGEVYSLVRTLFTVYEPGEPEFADLFRLADWAAKRMGGAVAIEDMEMRVVAYSSIAEQDIDDLRLAGILGRRVPDHAIQAEEYLAVLRAEAPIWCVEPRDHAPRLALGVHAHGQSFGTIWVVQGEEALHADASAVLTETAALAVPALARMALAADAKRRLRNEQLARLVQAVGPAEPLALALGLPALGPFGVFTFGPGDRNPDELDTATVADLVRNTLDSFRIQSTVGVADGQALAVVAGDPQQSLLTSVLQQALLRARERVGVLWHAGASESCATLDGLPDAAVQSQEALTALDARHQNAPAVAQHRRMAAELVFHALRNCTRASGLMRAAPYSTIKAHDGEHGTEYVKTLGAWAAASYDVPRAAEALYLHANTLRHRLNRVREFVDIDNPDLRLVLAMQLRLQELETQGAETTG